MEEFILRITGAAGRDLTFAVSRLRDGAYYYPDSGTWRKPGTIAAIHAPLSSLGRGVYEVRLPVLDPDQDYCVFGFDGQTRQVVFAQMVDGMGRKINKPRAGTDTGRPVPRNEYYGGFTAEIRPGRLIDLE